MSLLIKALANAERDKLADTNKKSTVSGLPLELAPKEELKLADDEQNAVKQKAEAQLSLEEEAGLGVIPTVSKKLESSVEKKPLENTTNQLNRSSGNKPKSLEIGQTEPKPLPKPTERVIKSQASSLPVDGNQMAAAKVFVANQSVKPSSSMGVLLSLGIGGALLILLGLQGYQYFNQPSSEVISAAVSTQPTIATLENAKEAEVIESKSEGAAEQVSQEALSAEAITEVSEKVGEKLQKKDQLQIKKNKTQKMVGSSTLAESSTLQNGDLSSRNVRNNEAKNSLKLISKSSVTGVDPVLLAAYQAFTQGDDANAQRQYRQILQNDVRNIDALLGMAAIAQRQGRGADAVGWYQKVVEVDPQNSIAQVALASPQTNTDVQSAESRIKSLLANQPESAHLHAMLGNIYAEQNQWASAQATYFDACRYAPNNADYVFNLAVSLEQIGKQKLALVQYQRALDLLNQSGGNSPDRATLEARIQALQ